jgi:hypothetical protein
MSVISLFSWCYRSRVIAIFETRGLQLRPVPVATFLPFNPQAVTKKNPMSQRRSNDVTRRSNVRFWMEKNGTIWRFEIPKSSKSGEEIILDRSLPFRSPILQVFVAANSNAVLRLVHVDLLDSESHIARPIKTHQDTSRWLLRWLLRLVLRLVLLGWGSQWNCLAKAEGDRVTGSMFWIILNPIWKNPRFFVVETSSFRPSTDCAFCPPCCDLHCFRLVPCWN